MRNDFISRQNKSLQESGVVLITALIILIIMTLLGLAGIRISTQEERMAGYSYDRGLAFQSSESALREAEAAIEIIKPEPTTAGCISLTSGSYNINICSSPSPSDPPRWLDTGFTSWVNATKVGSGDLGITPQYFAEYLGSNFPCGFDPEDAPVCKRYRITARAGTSARANAMVQSTYATD